MQRRVATWILCTGLVTGVGTGALFGAFAASGVSEGAVPVLAAWPFLMVLLGPLAARVARRLEGHGAAEAVAVAMACAAVALVLGGVVALGRPLVEAHFRCGTNDVALPFGAALSLCVVAAVGAGVALWVDPGVRRGAVLCAAAAALGVSSSLVAGAAARAATHPDVDGWLEITERVATLGPAAPGEVTVDAVAGLTVRRTCETDWCEVDLGGARTLRVLRTGAPFEVRRSDGFLLVATANGDTVAAFDARTLEPREVLVEHIADRVAPPIGWILAALAGLLLALALVARRVHLKTRERGLRGAREGHVDERGVVAFDDGRLPARSTPARPLPPGPALVLCAPGRGAYRVDGQTGLVRALPGTREQHLTRIEAERAVLDASALAATALTAAPLIASWASGLL